LNLDTDEVVYQISFEETTRGYDIGYDIGQEPSAKRKM
jgi:hypothetical protein